MPTRFQHPPSVPRSLRRRTGTLVSLTAVGALVAALSAGTAVTAAAAMAANPSLVVQAESYTANYGAKTEGVNDAGGGMDVGWLSSGDWMSYSNVDLGTAGNLRTTIRVSSANPAGGTLEVRADSLIGPVLGSYTIKDTGGWQRWVSQSVVVNSTLTGRHKIVVALHSPQPMDFVNVNWFSFTHQGAGTSTPMPSMTTPVSTPPTGSTPMPSMSMPATPPAGSIPTPMPSMTMPTGGWVSVDPVQQAAATKAFFALKPNPITNNPVKVPEFHASCPVSHHASDDPIVFPGKVGASHNHTFMGNNTTDANSTLASLQGGTTTCDPTGDKSAYWIPTLYANGVPVDPAGSVTIYYGSRLQDPRKTQPFPPGFRMITGDSKNQVDTPDHQGNHFWCAGTGGEIGRTADGVMPICAKTANLVRQITFADCWDGVHLDSPDHKSHVSGGDANGGCSGAFPVPIPNISFVIGYPQGMDTSHITLSSGTTFSMHADFFNAWDPAALAERVRTCLDQAVKCNAAGGF